MIDISIWELTVEVATILFEFSVFLVVIILFAVVFRVLFEVLKVVLTATYAKDDDILEGDLDDPIDEYRHHLEDKHNVIEDRLKKEWNQ